MTHWWSRGLLFEYGVLIKVALTRVWLIDWGAPLDQWAIWVWHVQVTPNQHQGNPRLQGIHQMQVMQRSPTYILNWLFIFLFACAWPAAVFLPHTHILLHEWLIENLAIDWISLCPITLQFPLICSVLFFLFLLFCFVDWASVLIANANGSPV